MSIPSKALLDKEKGTVNQNIWNEYYNVIMKIGII